MPLLKPSVVSRTFSHQLTSFPSEKAPKKQWHPFNSIHCIRYVYVILGALDKRCTCLQPASHYSENCRACPGGHGTMTMTPTYLSSLSCKGSLWNVVKSLWLHLCLYYLQATLSTGNFIQTTFKLCWCISLWNLDRNRVARVHFWYLLLLFFNRPTSPIGTSCNELLQSFAHFQFFVGVLTKLVWPAFGINFEKITRRSHCAA